MTGNFYDSQLIRIKIIKLITINEYQTRHHLSLMIEDPVASQSVEGCHLDFLIL